MFTSILTNLTLGSDWTMKSVGSFSTSFLESKKGCNHDIMVRDRNTGAAKTIHTVRLFHSLTRHSSLQKGSTSQPESSSILASKSYRRSPHLPHIWHEPNMLIPRLCIQTRLIRRRPLSLYSLLKPTNPPHPTKNAGSWQTSPSTLTIPPRRVFVPERRDFALPPRKFFYYVRAISLITFSYSRDPLQFHPPPPPPEP